MKNWPNRFKVSLALFILAALFSAYAAFNYKKDAHNYGPGSGIVFILPIPAAILGYVLGGILDALTKRK